jgi:hypothetical protein
MRRKVALLTSFLFCFSLWASREIFAQEKGGAMSQALGCTG